jgi:hypothetical protein
MLEADRGDEVISLHGHSRVASSAGSGYPVSTGMDSRLQLPPSFAAAMLALAAIAYVMAPIGPRAPSVPRKSKPALDRFRKTSKALIAALEEFQKAQREGATLDESRLGASPSGAERMTETLDGFRRARDRVLQSAQRIEAAAIELAPHTAALEGSFPGLGEAVSNAGLMISQFRDELLRNVGDAAFNALRETAGEILVRSLADAGFQEWVAALPIEDEPVFDEADVRPIYWDEARGWVGGERERPL